MKDSLFGGVEIPLSHFYLIEGDHGTVISLVTSALFARGVQVRGNPDVTIEEYMSFTVDDAALLRARQAQRSIGGGDVFYIISAHVLVREAEQALLKVLEEPIPGVHFIFIVRSLGHIADTIKSRAQIRRITEIASLSSHETTNGQGKKSALLSVAGFLSMSAPERLALIATFLKSHEDDDSTGALRDEAFAFLSELEPPLKQLLSKNPEEATAAITYIYNAKRYLGLRGMSTKMLLEYLATIVPRVGK